MARGRKAKGLGDTIEQITTATGIKSVVDKIAEETGISFVSIFHSLKEHKKRLRELFKEDYENLKE